MQEIEGEEDFQADLRAGIVNIDEGVDTWVTIGCYRETGRLDRMLRVFRKALTLAHYDQLHVRLRQELVSLHDRKGVLTARWNSARSTDLFRFVEAAWESEGEHSFAHEDDLGLCLARTEDVPVDSTFPPR